MYIYIFTTASLNVHFINVSVVVVVNYPAPPFVCVCECVNCRNYIVDSGTTVTVVVSDGPPLVAAAVAAGLMGLSSSVSDALFSGSISIRCAFRQTTKSMTNASTIMPDVVPGIIKE